MENVLDEFKALAAIPRPSKHEQAVGEYLIDRLSSMGLTVERDSVGNVIAELRPSPGCRHIPLVLLQAHMDMVCVADAGVEYNPLVDPIKLIRDEEYLRAEGTSLGADDGMGIALIVAVIKNFVEHSELKHGAIRAIFTVDEEAGMSGADALDAKYLTDATYLINCDSENCDELVIGSAGSVHVDFNRRLERRKPSGAYAFRVTIGGLKGGHSGEEINSGRANAIKVSASLLKALDDNGGRVELATLEGGKATNAIADRAEAIIVTALDEARVRSIVERFERKIKAEYGTVEPGLTIGIESVDVPESVIVGSGEIIELLNEIRNGVFSMSTAELVETSANVGIVTIAGERLTVRYFPRSSLNTRLIEIVGEVRSLGARLGFEVESSRPSTAWTENRNSRLTKLMCETFERQNGRSMNVKTIHAGLECSYFYEKNPALDIVSIGTTNENIHSPRERLKLSTVPIQYRLLRETLIELAAQSG